MLVSNNAVVISLERYNELVAAETNLDVVKGIVRGNRPYALETIADLFFIEQKKYAIPHTGESR